jgi:hypothetical protein
MKEIKTGAHHGMVYKIADPLKAFQLAESKAPRPKWGYGVAGIILLSAALYQNHSGHNIQSGLIGAISDL